MTTEVLYWFGGELMNRTTIRVLEKMLEAEQRSINDIMALTHYCPKDTWCRMLRQDRRSYQTLYNMTESLRPHRELLLRHYDDMVCRQYHHIVLGKNTIAMNSWQKR